MSVVLCVYGNHSIVFNGKEIADKQDVLNRLNSLKFEESECILEMCKQWNSPLGYSEEWDLRQKENLEHDLQIRTWRLAFEENDYMPHTNEYEFLGPYGLEIEITKYYIFISPWVGRYHFWYDTKDVKWRDTWRLIIYRIIHVLGGDIALYFPDNMSDLSSYLPTEYYMPEFDQLIRIISKEYSPPFTSFAEASKKYIADELDKDPFVIDKFEDILDDLRQTESDKPDGSVPG
jgi:hypothetical protein